MVIPHKSDIMKLSTSDLLARRRGLVESLGDVEHVMLGSIVEQTRKCGKTGCRCAVDEPHGPYTFLTTRRGRRGMRYVPSSLIPVIDAYLRRGQQAEAALAEISAINVELLARRELSEPSK